MKPIDEPVSEECDECYKIGYEKGREDELADTKTSVLRMLEEMKEAKLDLRYLPSIFKQSIKG